MNAELRDFFTRRSPGTGKAILGLWLTCWLTPAFASGLPQGGTITHGQGSISTPSATQMQIDQFSQRMAADFHSFDIAKDHGVNISQPGMESLFVGRITGESATQIFGTLTANGQVMLLNPRGVVFGEGSRVDTASLMASTLNVDVDKLMDGVLELEFSADLAGKIINRGTLTAATGGSVTLLGDEVINEGLIVADMGRVNLASGSKAFVTFDAERLIGVRVTEGALGGTGGDAAVANSGEIQADGGQILLTADAARDLFSMAVNNEGVLRANAAEVDADAGEIRLLARNGDTFNSGSIEATASGGQGGNIEVLGDRVAVTGGRIDASGATGGGDIKVGGAFQGKGDTPTASHTFVGSEAQIAADATAAGDGGEVIVWADNTARFHGDISARGGDEGGDGGFVEVSGKEHLIFRGDVDTAAPAGAAGTLLLDPRDIIIVGGPSGTGGDDSQLDAGTPGTILFADGDSATDFTISSGKLESFSGNVVLEAERDIFTSDAESNGFSIDWTLTTPPDSFTLRAGNDIIFDIGIATLNTVDGDLILSANDNGAGTATGSGAITIGAGVSVLTGGGLVDASGTGMTIGGSLNTGGGDFDAAVDSFDVLAGGSVASGGGALSILTDAIQLDDTVDSGAGLLSIVPLNGSRSIGLGGVAMDIHLDNAELGNLLSAGGLTIGSPTNFAVYFVSGAAFGGLTGGTLTLLNAAQIDIAGTGLSAGIDTQVTSANSDILFAALAEIQAPAQSVSLSAGGMIDAFAASPSSNVEAASVNLDANTTIGASNAIAVDTDALTFNASGAVALTALDGVTLAGTSTADSLALTAMDGSISGDATADVTVTNNASLTANGAGGFIDLTTDGVYDFGNLTFNSVGAVSISDSMGILLAGTSTADSLELIATTGTIAGNATDADVSVTGNASLTANGAGGLIQLNDPADSFDFGTLTFDTIGSASITETNGVVLAGASSADALTLTATDGTISGNATDADLTVTNLADLIANGTGGAISLNDPADSYDFGELTFNSVGAVAIDLATGAVLEAASTADSATITAATGDIAVADAASVTATGALEITADDGSITTVSPGPGAGALAGSSVTLTASEKVGDFDSFREVVTDTSDLTVTAESIFITQADPFTTLTARTTTGNIVRILSDTATGADELTYDFNNPDEFTFVGSGTDIDFTTDVGDVVLAGISTANSLTLNAVAGAISDDGTSNGTVTNNVSLSGTSITLDETYAFGSLTFNSAGGVSIAEADDTLLTGVSSADTLLLSSGGAITNDMTANLTVTGNASLGGTSITLGDQVGDSFTFGSLTFNSAGGVSIEENAATLLSGVSTADSLSLTSAAGITNDGSADVDVTNNASLAGTSITLGNQGGDVLSFGSLTFNSVGAVDIAEDASTSLSGVSSANSLLLISNDAITNDGTANLMVAGNASFDGTAITLGNEIGDSFSFGSLTFDSTGAVVIAEDAATLLTGPSAADSLSLTSTAGITNDGSADIDVTNNASLAGTSITLGNQGGDVISFGSLTFNSAGAVDIAEDAATQLSGTSTADSLLLISNSGISNDGTADLTVTANASFDGTSITLGDQGGDSFSFGSLTFNSGGAVTIEENAATLLSGGSTADNLTLTSTAGITNDATADVDVTNNASLSGTSITLGAEAGDLFNFGSLTFNSAGTVTISEDSATELAGASTAGNLQLTSAGDLTDAAAAELDVSGSAVITGSNINLADAASNTLTVDGNVVWQASAPLGAITIAADGTVNFGSLQFLTDGTVTINEDSATEITSGFAGVSSAGSLNLVSAGDVTDAAGTNIDVTADAAITGTHITLADAASDTLTVGGNAAFVATDPAGAITIASDGMVNFGNLTFNAAGTVDITEDSATQLVGDSTSDNLILTSTADITNAANATLDVAGNADLDGTSITLGDQASDDFRFGSLTFNSAGAVSIDEDEDMFLFGSNNALTASLTSTGGISVNGSVTTTGNSVSMIANDFVSVNADINAMGGGDIYLEGQGLGAGNYQGVSINSWGVTSAGGDITLIGTGGDSGNGNTGVFIQGTDGRVETGGTGSIMITGQGGAGNDAVGFLFSGPGAMANQGVVANGTGDVTVIGTGGANGERNRGILLRNLAAIGSMSGQVSLNGVAGATGAGDALTGVVIDNSLVITLDGGIDITGTASLNAGDETSGHHGVRIVNGSLIGSEMGTGISIVGTGGAAGAGTVNSSHGILVIDSEIAAEGGDLSLNGTAVEASPPTSESYGIVMFDADVFTEDGALSLTAAAENAAGLITNSTDFGSGGETNIGFDGNTGTLTLDVANDGTVDSLVFLGTTRILGAGDLRIQPAVPGTSIGIGDGAIGNLNLNQAEVAAIDDGFASIAIGRAAGEHAIQVGSAIFLDPTTIATTGAGTLTVVGGQTLVGGGGQDVAGDGNLILSAATPINLNGNVSSHSTSITLAGDVLVEGPRTLNSQLSGVGGDVTITGVVDGANAAGSDGLTILAGGGTADLQGDVEGQTGAQTIATGQDLQNLSVAAGIVNLQNVQLTDGDLTITSNDVNLNGATYRTHSTGDITFNGNLVLTADLALTADDGTVGFNGTLDSDGTPRNLLVTATTTSFGGAVGNLSELGSVDITGDTAVGGGLIQTAGDQIYGGDFSLGADSNLTTLANGSIDIAGAVDGAGSWALDITTNGTGTVDFGGSVGGTAGTDLTQLDVSSETINLAAAVDISTASNDGDITFATNNLNLAGDNDIDAGAGTFRVSGLDLAGSIEFAPSDSGTEDAFINSDFASVSAGAFVVGGTGQTGNIFLGNGTDGLSAAYSLNVENGAAGGIFFRNDYTAVGDRDLGLLAGTGGITLDTDAGAPLLIGLNLGSFLAQSDATLVESSEIEAAAITFAGTVDGTAGTEDLTLTAGTGTVDLQGAVGGNQSIGTLTVVSASDAQLAAVDAAALDVTADLITLNGAAYVAQTGNIALTGDVVLTTDASFDSSAGGGDIVLTGSLDSDDDATRRSATFTAAAGSVDLQGDVGSTAALNGFDIASAAAANLASVRANSIAVTADGIFLNGTNYTALMGGLTLDGDVTLQNDVTLDSTAGGDLQVTGTIDSDGTARDLALLAGASLADLQGDVGVGAALDSFTLSTTGNANLAAVQANDIDGAASLFALDGDLTALNGGIDLDGNVTQLQTLSLDSSAAGGDIGVTGTINGAAVNSQGLTLAAGTGAIDLAGDVGGTAALTDFLISSAATADLASVSAETIDVTATAINLNGGSYLTTAGVAFTGNTNLTTAVSVDAGAGPEGITFDGTVDGTQALTLAAGTGDISFTGAVGGTTALGAVTLNAANDVTADAAFTAGSVNQAVAGTGTTSFAGLLTANTGTIDLDANAVTLSDGARSFGQAVTLTGLDGDVTVAGSGITTTAAAHSGVTSGAIVIDVLGAGAVDITAPLNTTGAANNAGSGSSGGAIGIATNGGDITIGAGPVGSDGGDAIGGNNAGGAAGNIAFGGGLITLNGTSFTAVGGAGAGAGAQGAGAGITFNSDVLLATGPVALTTGATGGSIAFNAALDGGQDLSLTAGTGSIDFVGAVGSGARLGALAIQSAANVTANALTTASISQLAGTGTSTFNGAVDTDAAAGVNLLTNHVALNAGVTTANGGGVTTNLGGVLSIAAAGDIAASGPVSLTAAGGIQTAGDVTTDETDVSFASATTLTGPVAIDTGAGAGDISFASTVNGAQDLSLAAGTGNIDFVGAVGGSTRLGAVEIGSATDVTANAVTAASLVQLAGSGITTLNGAVNTDAVAGVSLTGSDLAVNAGITTSNAGVVTFDMANAITIAPAGDINAAGAVSLTAASGITTAGDVTTAGADVDFLSATTLTTNAVAVSTGAGAGSIQFADTLDGGQNLTLTAGTGSIDFVGDVGATTRLGALQVVSAADVTTNALTLGSLTQVAGSGTTTLNGMLDTNAAGGVNLSGFDLAVNAPINTSNGGGVTASMGGAIAIDAAGDINADGAVSLTAVGGITTAGDVVTNNANVTFASATALADAVAIDTGMGAGNVSFASTLNGGFDLTLTAGSGNVNFAGVVGGTDALGQLTVASANDVTANAMTLASLSQLAGSGITTLNGVVNAAGDVSLTGTRLAVNQTVNTTTGGDLTVNLSDIATFASTGDVNADGDVALTAANGISTAGDVTTSGGDVDFLSNTTLTGPVALATAGGDLTFATALNGNQSLTIDAGTGAVTFTGLVGDQARLGALTIDNAGNLTANGIRAASLTQAAGTGSSTFNGGTFTDAVTEAVTVAGAVSVNSADISLQNRLTAGTSVNLTGSGNMAIAAAGDILAGAGVTLTAGGGITTAGNVVSNGGAITFASPSTLSGPVALASNGGDITLAAMAGGAQNLTVNAGAGALSLASLSNGGSIDFAGAATASIGDLAAESATVNAGGSYGFNGTVAITNALTLNGLDSATFSGSVTAGSFTGNAADSTVTFNAATDITGALAITDGAQVNVNGALTAGSMTAAATDTGLAFNDAVNVTGATNLANTGMTVFGNDGDTQTFAGGLNAAGPITTFATLRTAGQAMTLGALTQAGDSVFDTTNDGGSAAGAALTVGAVDGAGFDLGLRAGSGGTTTLAALGNGGAVDFVSADNVVVAGDLQAADAIFGAANAFTVAGALDLGSLDTSGAGAATVTLTGGGSVDAATVFENTGDLNLGDDAADRFLFAGGLDTTATLLNLNGIAATDSTAISVGALTLTGDGQIDSTNAGDPLTAGAAVTLGAVTGTAGTEVLQVLAGVGDVTAEAGVADVGSFFVRSSGTLALGPVQTNGNSIRTLSAGDVNLNGNLTADLGDVSIISTGGTITQADETIIESLQGNVHLVGFNEIGVFDVRAVEGSILLALLDTADGGLIRRLADPFAAEPDLRAGNLVAVVSSGAADFGIADDGFRIQGQQQFFGMSGGDVFIRQSNAATQTSLPIAQQNAFVSVLEQVAGDRANELPIDAGLLFAARNALGQGSTTIRLDQDALREFQAQTQQSDEEEVLTDLGEEVFLDIALFDFDRERPLCLPEALQGPDAAPCSGQSVAAWFDRLAEELMAAAARESAALRMVQQTWSQQPAALSSGGQ